MIWCASTLILAFSNVLVYAQSDYKQPQLAYPSKAHDYNEDSSYPAPKPLVYPTPPTYSRPPAGTKIPPPVYPTAILPEYKSPTTTDYIPSESSPSYPTSTPSSYSEPPNSAPEEETYPVRDPKDGYPISEPGEPDYPVSEPGNEEHSKGYWSEWTKWSGCSLTCGEGVAKRTRTCDKHRKDEEYGSGQRRGYKGSSHPEYYKPNPSDNPELPDSYPQPAEGYFTPSEYSTTTTPSTYSTTVEYSTETPSTNPPTVEYTTTTSPTYSTITTEALPTAPLPYYLQPRVNPPQYPHPQAVYKIPPQVAEMIAAQMMGARAGRARRQAVGYEKPAEYDFQNIFEGQNYPGEETHRGYGREKFSKGCDGPDEETRPCNEKACPIDGGWSSWNEWSLCSATCGDGGLKHRNRTCDDPVPKQGGKLCRGTYIQTELCSSWRKCPIDGGWSDWTSWTECSVTCGAGGSTLRERTCTEPIAQHGGLPCDGDSKQVQGCCKEPCPIDGEWGPWSAWSLPTVSCGTGATVNRTRYCDTPTQAYGGRHCQGISFSVEYVHLPPCPVHGGWSRWSRWSDCSVTCGRGGFTARTRVCDHPSPLYGGKFCVGDATQSELCDRKPCAIDGGWSQWYGWSSCSATCGFGGRVYRKRYCDHPKPTHNGVQCVGDDTDSKFCFVRHCAIHGVWSAWTDWVYNSITCGEGGTKTRHRYCNNPEPMYEGRTCPGEDKDIIPVKLPDCPVDGGWSGWGSWTEPSVTCGDGGIITRRRTCSNPHPSSGGSNCLGDDLEIKVTDLVPCPVCGGWSEWSEWSECSRSCGSGGLISRSRDCTNPPPAYGGYQCAGEPSETTSCIKPSCPVHGGWSGWGEWTLCSATCGDAGQRQRSRHCDNPTPAYNGLHCEGVGVESASCQGPACPIDGKWSGWGPWSPCTVTCGFGATSSRTRACASPEPAYGGRSCAGSYVEYMNVTVPPCPVQGGWTGWSEWTKCSASCGQGGTMTRQRQCTNPQPKYGGEACKGDAKEARFCSSKPCPVNGDWGSWSEFSACSVTCGDGGIKSRSRVCDKPPPAYDGAYCPGVSSEIVECSEKPCAINGGWGEWSPWSAPSKTCGYDVTVSRTRNCDKPSPSSDGELCDGISSQTTIAGLIECPVNGGWTSWTGWSLCSVTCGSGGVTKRHRYCENPEPSNGGENCAGEAVEVSSCAAPKCPVSGGWTEWSAWSKCSVTCGEGGWVTRTRVCTHPAPQHGGAYCEGLSSETIPGYAPPCPIDGGWGKWAAWSSCSISCGLGGSRTRTRACDNPTPAYHGKPCNADSQETKNCSAPLCPVDGYWSEWSEWSRCSSTCGEGQEQRRRACDNPEPRYGGRVCADEDKQSRLCKQAECPVDGGWSSWSEWSDKSVSCGSGAVIARKRRCDNPTPASNGKYCTGSHVEVKNATIPPCVEDGGWSEWCQWSACSVTCGYGGSRTRSRACTHPAPSPYGQPCVGDQEEKISCFAQQCPVDGGWTSWCSWSSCSVTCGDEGESHRTRSCENPLPAHGGHRCTGEGRESQRCSARPCSIDGGWTKWTEWATCSVTCGEKGITTRTRTCTNPSPENAGRNCKGVNYETKNCTEPPCAVNGGWSLWGAWSDCSQSCGYGGKTTRTRACTAPAPDHGGENCKGAASDTKHCFKNPCNNWSEWSEWSSCIKKCGMESYVKRTRRCMLPARPSTYGQHIVEWCEGDSAEFKSCAAELYDYDSSLLPTDVQSCQGRVETTCFNDWVVVAQRVDDTLHFNKSWAEYKKGFGEPNGNFYIGNENLHCLTRDGTYKIRIDAILTTGEWVYTAYSRLVVAGEDESYKLTVMDHEGGAGIFAYENGMPFSTYDRDNDKSVYGNCAKIHCGGWWFNACYQTCLTCDYKRYFESKALGAHKSILKMRMMIQRKPDLNMIDDSYGAEIPEFPEQYAPESASGQGGYGRPQKQPGYPVPVYDTPGPYLPETSTSVQTTGYPTETRSHPTGTRTIPTATPTYPTEGPQYSTGEPKPYLPKPTYVREGPHDSHEPLEPRRPPYHRPPFYNTPPTPTYNTPPTPTTTPNITTPGVPE